MSGTLKAATARIAVTIATIDHAMMLRRSHVRVCSGGAISSALLMRIHETAVDAEHHPVEKTGIVADRKAHGVGDIFPAARVSGRIAGGGRAGLFARGRLVADIAR